MYFVDREQIEQQLLFMERQLQLLKEQSSWNGPLEEAAFERLAVTVIESVLDVGNAMIDGFIMRDPGSYEDIVDILHDEKVIDDSLMVVLKKVISYRKMLVQQYYEIEHAAVIAVFEEAQAKLEQFPSAVRTYLTDELGPVSAFRN